ncbi:Uncharacterized protein FWK35_00027728 [Aphis craccivora]|uniref:Nucleic-acid-binding protein n=1 Tax=Aphis craccivora TaxID=307492 RepID=A0A6G0YPW9_APHCR|nr:Uncharacterized protein FWK35_00027728 [Aphis craccivora]
MPLTPKTTKRNLSNSSPNNLLTTPSTSTTEDPDRPSHKAYKVHNGKPVAPLIHIKNISNFSAFNNVLKNITRPNGFTCKSIPSYLIVQPTDKRTYNAVIVHLHETSANFHSFPPSQTIAHTESSSTIYIISPYTPILLSLLLNWDIQSRVFTMPNTGTTANFHENRKPIKKRRGPPKFHNCQDYEHTKNYCNHEARCVKCDENHLTIECTKDRNNPVKCALCAKDHTANFKGCTAFVPIFKKSAQKFQPVKNPDSHFQQSQPRTKTKSHAETTIHQ